MSEKINLSISIQKPFGNLFREATVLILCKTPQGTYLMGEKENFYPTGISRLLGGGVEEERDSSLITAAQAELEEEISYRPLPEALEKFGEIHIHATAADGTEYSHTAHLFYTEIPAEAKLKASDDVSGLCELTLEELETLAHTYTQLSTELSATEGSLTYSWFDYGQVYAPIHAFAARFAREKEKGL